VGIVRGVHVQLVPVTIGHDFGSSVEITSGLSPADEVILDPPDSLATGMEVHANAASQRGRS
jgi:multidrug efflux pump subunit AcrA (membrane-fusion protein)